jgi:dCMP deaminase
MMQDIFIKTALLLSQKSHCVSKKVGAVIVKDDRIISMGYNGTPPGFINCDQTFNEDNYDREKHHEWSNKYESHAELSCLLFSIRRGINIENAEMYVTLHPCDQCIKNLVQSGIKKIYYLFDYDKNDKENKLLTLIEIKCLLDNNIQKFINDNVLIKLY